MTTSEERLRDAAARALERCQVADDPSGAADEAATILEQVVNLDATPAVSENMAAAIEAMGFVPDTLINLLGDPKTPPHGPGQREYQRHVAIEWEGGVIWLNLFDFATGDYEGEKENRHFCIDVRQFNSAGRVKGQGVFTMSRGYRGVVGVEGSSDDEEMMVGAHGWDGGYLVAIMTDPDGEERFTDKEKEE
jgi:hypothetical protein